jgi:hypothetical protein
VNQPRGIGPERSGIYRTPEELAQLRRSVALTGGIWFALDLDEARDKAQLMELFERTCRFPANFGANWDALADSLQDFSWCPACAYVFHLRGAAALAARSPSEWATLFEVLAESAAFWCSRGKTFVVFADVAELPAWS